MEATVFSGTKQPYSDLRRNLPSAATIQDGARITLTLAPLFEHLPNTQLSEGSRNSQSSVGTGF